MKPRLMLRINATAAIVALLLSPQLFSQTPPAAPVPTTAATAPTAPAAANAPAPPGAPAVPAAPPALIYKDGVVKVGNDLKQSKGRVTDVDKGDNGCYITLRNEKNNEFIEVALFPICAQKPPFKGKQVEMTYNMETIQAGDCYGDPKCKRTETIPVVTAVKILE